MQLLRLHDVKLDSSDRVFRHARLRALIIWLAGFSLTVFLFFKAYSGKWVPGYIFGPGILLFLLLTRKFVTARFHPTNWLVRMNDTGIYVQYRSYLNSDLPPDDPSVVFLSYGDIASARLIKERVEKPDPAKPGATQTQYLRYVELELPGDTGDLVTALSRERGESAPLRKHWYGTSSTLYRDYPVSIDTPPFLRIRWDVVPGSSKFLESIRPYAPITDTVSLNHDFSHLQSLSPEEQRSQLRLLAQRGDIITASYLASKLKGCNLAEAKNMVEALQREP